MARGWESKAVEAQQHDALDLQHVGPPVNLADAERRSDLDALNLAKVRATADLANASAKAHRTMLEKAIAELDRRIAALSDGH
jgi:hypothetical protein